ncbi:hypothetical protein P43SY_005682 [Pythium insidiosum]|uniref:Crinkler effector protein N-terminal domain-containing protein n=1 Tax=Pythium insidiosum TaxID=114742 RepID=A0AAD5M5X4_PYTIN|nr:hypothetical protein P43SY_005682 [Pythium insidiosum]
MAEVELECAVYGEGTVFPVKIARDAKVSALQEAIVEKKKDVNAPFNVDPALVTVYLAKKDGVWLKDDDNVKDFLRGKIDKQYKEMRPSWALNDKEYFGKKKPFQPGYKEIHILVELPEVAVGYIGGGFDGSEDNEQFLSFGYTFHGIPPDLPSRLPPDVEDESNED